MLVSLGLLLAATATLQEESDSARPRFVADPDHEIRDSLGGGAQSFTIESAVLGEVRRVNVVPPPISLVTLTGLGLMSLSDKLLIALISSTVAELAGLVLVVAKYLFPTSRAGLRAAPPGTAAPRRQ